MLSHKPISTYTFVAAVVVDDVSRDVVALAGILPMLGTTSKRYRSRPEEWLPFEQSFCFSLFIYSFVYLSGHSLNFIWSMERCIDNLNFIFRYSIIVLYLYIFQPFVLLRSIHLTNHTSQHNCLQMAAITVSLWPHCYVYGASSCNVCMHIIPHLWNVLYSGIWLCQPIKTHAKDSYFPDLHAELRSTGIYDKSRSVPTVVILQFNTNFWCACFVLANSWFPSLQDNEHVLCQRSMCSIFVGGQCS